MWVSTAIFIHMHPINYMLFQKRTSPNFLCFFDHLIEANENKFATPIHGLFSHGLLHSQSRHILELVFLFFRKQRINRTKDLFWQILLLHFDDSINWKLTFIRIHQKPKEKVLWSWGLKYIALNGFAWGTL